jgi:TatA/E family protein of Tat protein translocase
LTPSLTVFLREQVKKRVLLFIFEGLGTSELFLILVVALVLFGPRKLPQLSRSLGKSLANFKRASEDFKETWEKEVARETAFKEALVGEAMLPKTAPSSAKAAVARRPCWRRAKATQPVPLTLPSRHLR